MNKLHKALDRLHAGRKREEGFTLIELIIVVVIIGILTAIAIPSYGAIQGTARANSVKAAASDSYSSIVSNVANGDTTAAAIKKVTDKYPASGDIIVTATGTNEDDVVVTAKWKDGKYETTRGTAPAAQ